MFQLKDLHNYDAIVIQCHDNPDVDAISSGYALMRYLQAHNVATKLIYGGYNAVSKPNISQFIETFSIPLEYVGRELKSAGALFPQAHKLLLLTVDCQYGAGNVTRIEAPEIAVVDHHLQEVELPPLHVLEPYLGSCATVVWRLITPTSFELREHKDISTALYYGLYTDTNSLSEIFHPIDRDMLESLDFDATTIRRLKNNNLTQPELVIAGNALIEARHNEQQATNLFRAAPCDPNILGFISDLTIQAQGVTVCAGFCEINGGVKLSIRSATYEVMANEVAAYLTEGYGSGGGNKEKAGGFMRLPDGENPMEYLSSRLRQYFATFDVVRAGQQPIDTAAMGLYKKLPVPVGYVKLEDIYPSGTDVIVRTLEGDASFTVSSDSYLMVGIQGEVYPIHRDKFEASYKTLPGAFSFMPQLQQDGFYAPTVKDRLYGRSTDLLPYTKPCVSGGQSIIFARPLEKNTKVFADWYKEGYMFGRPGDYIAARQDDPTDIYIIARQIFELTYEPA